MYILVTSYTEKMCIKKQNNFKLFILLLSPVYKNTSYMGRFDLDSLG